MGEQLSERGKDLVKYMPQAVNALDDRLIEKLTERVLYGEKPQTNADRIRAMTDEELAKWMAGRKEACPPRKEYKCSKMTCAECWLDWMREVRK